MSADAQWILGEIIMRKSLIVKLEILAKREEIMREREDSRENKIELAIIALDIAKIEYQNAIETLVSMPNDVKTMADFLIPYKEVLDQRRVELSKAKERYGNC